MPEESYVTDSSGGPPRQAEQQDLTLEDVRARVEKILEADRHNDDPESAHWDEDALYRDVLRAVADGHPWSIHMAAECLRIGSEVQGTRWWA